MSEKTPNKIATKPITVTLDGQLGRALRQYKKDTKLTHAEVVYRALICYWLQQNTPAASLAVNTADLRTEEAWAAYLDIGEFEQQEPTTELGQALHTVFCKLAGRE